MGSAGSTHEVEGSFSRRDLVEWKPDYTKVDPNDKDNGKGSDDKGNEKSESGGGK